LRVKVSGVAADNQHVSFSVSPQVRVLALVGVLVAVAGGLAMMVMSHAGSTSSAPPKVIRPLHAHRAVVKPSVHVTKPAVKPVVKAAARPVVKPVAKPVVKAVAKPVVTPVAHAAKYHVVARNGLPTSISAKLETHDVVVVSLYEPNRRTTQGQRNAAESGANAGAATGVDAIALAEAAAGAKDAGAGFVGVDVLSQKDAKPLAALFGVLEDPSVLIFTRVPGKPVASWKLSLTLTGYADRTSVAQAAANSRP
jgi:hypothetical protein